MINRDQLGKRIREARTRAGLSQQQLAHAMGVSDKTISAYEVGRVDPPLDALDRLSTATLHPIAFFLGDLQTGIEARLDKIAQELLEIRKTLTAEVKTAAEKQPDLSTLAKPEQLQPTPVLPDVVPYSPDVSVAKPPVLPEGMEPTTPVTPVSSPSADPAVPNSWALFGENPEAKE